MNAFLTVADALPKAARAITAPATQPGSGIARVPRARAATASPPDHRSDLPGSHIEPWMAAAFAGLVQAAETDAPYALLSCTMNGKPAAIIAYLRDEGDRRHVLPLFVAVQQGMSFQPDEDDVPDD